MKVLLTAFHHIFVDGHNRLNFLFSRYGGIGKLIQCRAFVPIQRHMFSHPFDRGGLYSISFVNAFIYLLFQPLYFGGNGFLFLGGHL